MLEDPDRTDFGQYQLCAFKFESSLRIGERLVPSFALESGVARFISCLDPSKERLEGFIESAKNIL
jgi:hypothetical protein